MWCIIYPVRTIPVITLMFLVSRRAAKKLPPTAKSVFSGTNTLETLIDLFYKLDILGIFLLTTALSLTLIPLTLAGGETRKWKTPGIITP